MNYAALVTQFNNSSVNAIALFGSHARGDAGPHSDIDLIRFVADDVAEPPGSGSHLIDDTLVTVSDYNPTTVASWFTEPTAAVTAIAPLRQAQPLWDEAEHLARLQARAHAFRWNADLQAKADQWASAEMVGWIEEAHKGLAGLRRDDVGRLLNASIGLSFGLANVVKVQRGVLVYSDNSFLDQVIDAVGQASEWARQCRTSFGIATEPDQPPTLRERVAAGLRLYATTAELLTEAIQPADTPLVTRTVERIGESLPG